MEKHIENKAVKPEVNKEAYSFPEYGVSIVASSQEEAREKLAERLKADEKKAEK